MAGWHVSNMSVDVPPRFQSGIKTSAKWLSLTTASLQPNHSYGFDYDHLSNMYIFRHVQEDLSKFLAFCMCTWLSANTRSTSDTPSSFLKKVVSWGITSSTIVSNRGLATAFAAFLPPAAAAFGFGGLAATLGFASAASLGAAFLLLKWLILSCLQLHSYPLPRASLAGTWEIAFSIANNSNLSQNSWHEPVCVGNTSITDSRQNLDIWIHTSWLRPRMSP